MPAYTPPAATAVDFDVAAYTPPASTAVDFDLESAPPVGPTLSAYAGVTNGSGVSSLNALSDVVLAGTPGVYRVTLTAGAIVKRLHIQTE